MKKLLIIALAVSVLCVLLAGPSLADEAKKAEAKKAEAKKVMVKKVAIPAGQKAFTEARCQTCHTVYSAGIGEPPKEESTEKAADEGPPDLSLAGTGRTAKWLGLFLQKEEELNEKKHMLKFKGSDEDLATLVSWILTLKAPEVETAPAKKAAEAEKAAEPEAPAKSDAPAKTKEPAQSEAPAKSDAPAAPASDAEKDE